MNRRIAADVMKIAANQVAEIVFTSSRGYPDAFNEVELDVLITAPDGQRRRVPAFWAGGHTWKVRYASGLVGMHTYRTVCSDTSNPALHDVTGALTVRRYTGKNLLYRHGPPGVAPDGRHFAHADGTPFFWLADTWWMGLCRRLRWPDEFRRLTADRVEKGFTVVQIVAGLYPDMAAFDERGANEHGFPWTRDYGRIEPAYFDAADRRIAYLVDAGLAPCIVGAWGYHLPWMGVERMKKHWRYLVARYGAYPVFWCVAGEANLPYYLVKGFPFEDAAQVKGWTEVARYLRRIDPFRRPVSVHPTGLGRLNARGVTEDIRVLDFDMLQTGHGDRAALGPTVEAARAAYAARPALPFVNSEVCYEGILNSCFDDIQRLMFWSCLLSGAAGHTYGANGIWQLNRRGAPYGKSPHGGSYGDTPWDEAMRLPGSRQLGLAKRLLERYEWWRCEPHPEWAAFDGDTELAWGDWIWFPEGDPAADAPVAARYFRRTFVIPPGKQIARAILRLSADDRFTAFVNGERIGEHHGWTSPREFEITPRLSPGRNIVAVQAENLPAPVQKNPAGLLCSLGVIYRDGTRLQIISDESWRSSRQRERGWESPEFEDGAWQKAMRAARYGEGPWRRLDAGDAYLIPYAAGIPGSLRIIYVPLARAVQVRHLEPGGYRAHHLDPAEGTLADRGMVRPDREGAWLSPPPAHGKDWALVLVAR